jgi:hypothetical protein
VWIDLRNIKSPIVVFCSWGDNITPPQQALDWILDLYDSDKEIAANGQTIIYALHQTMGHLAIFVSAKFATKEHEEFGRTINLIDVLPPGLYEAVISDKGPDTARPELVSGNYPSASRPTPWMTPGPWAATTPRTICASRPSPCSRS